MTIRSVLTKRVLGTRRATVACATRPNSTLLQALQELDTPALCDADKKLFGVKGYKGIQLLPNLQIIPTNQTATMVGIVRTAKLLQRNDFLGVVQGILESTAGEVLVVGAQHSNRAIAGNLLMAEAQLQKLQGLVILNGFMRDSSGLRELSHVRCFAQGITPYSGTCMHPAEMQCSLTFGDVAIQPGDVIVGDDDGVLVGSLDTFTQLLPVAQEIHSTETVVRERQRQGQSLVSVCNIQEHLQKRLKGEDSQFGFEL